MRPPGHHAETHAFGGFCYFNNAAIAANLLARYGKVAILDIDYHHGNGQQEIFYNRADVLTVSVHGHPSFAYPYFAGFRDETGIGAGAGYNFNIPLPEHITPEQHRNAIAEALRRVKRFGSGLSGGVARPRYGARRSHGHLVQRRARISSSSAA